MGSSIQIEEQASAWLVKRDSGEWTEADQAELSKWLDSIPNRVAFIRLEGAWRRAQRLKALGAGTARGTVPEPSDWKRSPFFDRRMPVTGIEPPLSTPRPDSFGPGDEGASAIRNLGLLTSMMRRRSRALAATLLIAALGAGTWFLWPAGPDYRTPVGGLASVPMTDGSKVTLNTNSEIRIAITEHERRVELEQGEAFFEVAKDPRRPFVVEAGDKRVTAVGTKFSVRRDLDDVQVVVTEGQVRVERRGAPTEPPAHLLAGAIARAGEAGIVLQQRPLPEAEAALSWRTGYLVFRDTALADAVAEFNRYNTRQIVIQDQQVAMLQFSGNLRATNFEGFVRLIEAGFPVSVRQEGATIVLTKN